jgi:hypothetical protein
MIQEDILRMAREVGFVAYGEDAGEYRIPTPAFHGRLQRFAAIVASAEREKVAHWMRSMGYATGHGDTIEDLLEHLGTQIAEGLLMEREACAKVCDEISEEYGRRESRRYPGLRTDAEMGADVCAVAIRARGNK